MKFNKIVLTLLSLLFISYATSCTSSDSNNPDNNQSISGTVVSGYRILPIQKSLDRVNLTVFRGDYIKFKFDNTIITPLLSIPELSIEQRLSADINRALYFKMKKTGLFSFSLGNVRGDLKVIDYHQANYKEVTSKEAAELIRNIRPLILDVRTGNEYKQGYLKDSILIPVQQLQARITEIGGYKNQDILIYCATGNRSTVASKILIDKGFKRIYNMRHGIYDWHKNKYPIIR